MVPNIKANFEMICFGVKVVYSAKMDKFKMVHGKKVILFHKTDDIFEFFG